MGIEWDSPGKLPPLKVEPRPAVPVEMLAAIGQVTLSAGNVRVGALREFYERILGLRFAGADEQEVCFTHEVRRIRLRWDTTRAGRAAFLLRNFGDAMLRLRGKQIGYELIHADGGLSRMAIVRDPAGNWVYLLETRPL